MGPNEEEASLGGIKLSEIKGGRFIRDVMTPLFGALCSRCFESRNIIPFSKKAQDRIRAIKGSKENEVLIF